MPDMYFDVDVAITECPVNLLPLLDATDFKTIEDAVAYNAAGMALYWHFCTSAGAYTVTAVTPTAAGNYDWTDQGAAGIYTIEIPASGGASINNDTEGYGWFTGVATGVLPWRGPVIGFRAAALNDALCDGGDNLDVNTVQWLGTACATPTVAGVPEVDVTHVAGATTNVAALATNADAIKTKTDFLPSATAGAAGGVFIAGSNAATSVTTAFTANITGNLSGSVGSVTGAVGSVTGAVGSVTSGVTVTTNNDKTGYALTATTGLGNQTANITGNLSGSVGSVSGAVGSVTGNVGGNVAGSVASVTTAVAITSNIKQNQALSGFTFLMTDSTNHNPATGKTVTVTRSIDGAAFAAGTLSAVTEVANGIYSVNFGAGDLNGKVIILQATAAASDTTFERIVTQV